MRVLAVTNIYPSAELPASGVFIEQQIKGLLAIGLEVRVLFIDRRREGPMAYYRAGPRIRRAVGEFAPDLLHVMYGGVMAVARHLLDGLRGAASPSKTRVIPCGIDLDRFKSMDQRGCQERLGWEGDRAHVLFATSAGDPVKRPRLARSAIEHLTAGGAQ